MKVLDNESAFLAMPEPELCSYENSRFVIQQVPYEYTSSYISGSEKGPASIVSASHFVEFYDEELEMETYKKCGGIATLDGMDFEGFINEVAVDMIEKQTSSLLDDGKFVVSVGAEHTVSYGFVKAHAKKFDNLSILQFDAHSDLRMNYQGNPYSHASVMARINEMNLPIVQIGIRAQCAEEAKLIKSSSNINTFYAHQIRKNPNWINEAISKLSDNVYITIDADGFDPSIMPAVGTAEPNGLFWVETLDFFREVFRKKNVVGFDVVECAPLDGSILSEYTLAKLIYRLIGYKLTGK
ncbi:MAG: agmatinase [Bacteroidetes bacterium]|mgnify:CR=1 FL=1|nr:MAG: agmatinase [Bacteroidota bacterium]REJ99795.1 MAG: agmatinase [Bacteroidota bacterium]REK34168.1 MAG: agmatinase [Bacteroidota bacterium]REK50498.1 MAG: agmatinase [Bacteroidota bacterium]